MRPVRRPGYDRVKRLADVVTAGTGLMVTAPVLVLIALVVRRDLGMPVLFRQVRPGRDGLPFELVKFRTMRSAAVSGEADADRLTRLGRSLRATSLDELPTLWNVLRGDMSIVGPRPLLLEYVDLYTPEQARRHDVRPGVTGLAQTSGRNAVPWERRFALDVEYVDQRSLSLDLRILRETVSVVLRRRGVHAHGEATVSAYRGPGASARSA